MFFHYLFWVTLLLIALRLTIYIFTCEKLFQIYATFSLSTHRTLVMHVFLCLMLPHIFLRLYSFPSFLCWLFFKLHTLLFCLHLYWFCLLTIHIFCWSSLGKKKIFILIIECFSSKILTWLIFIFSISLFVFSIWWTVVIATFTSLCTVSLFCTSFLMASLKSLLNLTSRPSHRQFLLLAIFPYVWVTLCYFSVCVKNFCETGLFR